MIELLLRFKMISHFYIFLIATAACIVWVYACQKNNKAVNLWPVIILNFMLLITWGILFGMSHDDVGYLHFSWMISKGLVPFKDFWDHHSPFLPLLIAPLVKKAPQTPIVYDIARIFSGCVFLINTWLGWHIARQVWREKARLSVYLLVVFSASIFAQYLLLRPDIFMIFFMLAGISICLDIPNREALPCFFSGIAFGLGLSFIPKQYFLTFLPIIAIFLGNKPGRIGKLSAYAAGFLVGLAPLGAYLFSYGIFYDFIYWVIGFNGKALQVAVHFPLVILLAGIWGAHALMRRFSELRDDKAVLIFYAFFLSTLSSLTAISDLDMLYYLGLWYFLCAITACGAGIPELLGRISSFWKRTLIVGLIFGALLSQNFSYIWKYRHADFIKDKKVAAELMRYTKDDTCVIFLPIYPVFAHDATKLYSSWQYYFATVFPQVLDDVKKMPVAHRIMALKPAVVQCRYNKKDLLLDLYQRKIITSADYKVLIAFMVANYSQQQIGDNIYYVRNDLL